MLINQPEPVFSFTIPYYTSTQGDTSELFVSEKTYEKYLLAMNTRNIYIVLGSLHPISPLYGEVTTTLYDKQKMIILIGTKDIQEYTTELLDICIAQELEKVILIHPDDFFRFLYNEKTPQHMQTFIDDIQQTVEEIHIAKRLKKSGYRIQEREAQIASEILINAAQFSELRQLSPYENEQALFLLSKLIFLAHVEENLYRNYKTKLQPYYPKLFIEVDRLLKILKKVNLSTAKGRERSLSKIFSSLKMASYTKKLTIEDLETFDLSYLKV